MSPQLNYEKLINLRKEMKTFCLLHVSQNRLIRGIFSIRRVAKLLFTYDSWIHDTVAEARNSSDCFFFSGVLSTDKQIRDASDNSNFILLQKKSTVDAERALDSSNAPFRSYRMLLPRDPFVLALSTLELA